jgi:glycosyltransferase involved in cell wall biosynthesis
VIIPTFRRASYLSRAIDSVLNQTYENIEVIVVDDNGNGSKYQAQTQQLMERLYGENPKVVYIKNDTNIGGANARNRGVEACAGDYLCFLDDDDVFLPYKIEIQLKYMVENKLDLSFTDIKMHDTNDRVVDVREHGRYVKSLDNAQLLKYHLMHHLTPTDTYMFQREAFFKAGGFKQRVVSDEFLLMLSAIEADLKIGYLNKITAIQYIHGDGRISSAKGRVEGDKGLHRIKKRYYHLLTAKERRYVQFRYHGAFAFYYFRNKNFLMGFLHFVGAIFTAPIVFIKEGVHMIIRTKRA